MCGIVGICATNPILERSWLGKGSDSLFHRGPDDNGEWWSDNGKVGFGHRRLSILDLTEAGHQPMLDKNSQSSIIFNGEIYNYKELRDELRALGKCFYTNSDTEVLLASYSVWGVGCLQRLNGMYSFAIYDGARNTVFIARDRAGEKPLFYHLDKKILRFGSEIKSIILDSSLPRRINNESLDCFLAMGYVPGGRCILDGFSKLPPAHYMIFNTVTGHHSLHKYWSLPEYEFCTRNESNILDDVERLLESSVKRQMCADVSVGVLLSGGVDSSLITAMASRVSGSVNTFTVGFPGHEQYDETVHARLIANYYGTTHTEIAAEPVNVDTVIKLARQFDEPIADSSMIPTYLVSRVIRQFCKVALGGDGGDELFGGYRSHSRIVALSSRLGWVPYKLRRCQASFVERAMPLGSFGRNFLLSLGYDFKSELPNFQMLFDRATRKLLLPDMPHIGESAENIRSNSVPKNKDALQRLTRMDFQNYMAEDILVKVDRASMLNSLEIRAPMLDYHLIEYAYRHIPSNLKATSTERKIIPKKLAERILPKEFDLKRKQGFTVPLDSWLRTGPFREICYDLLSGNSGIFNYDAIKNIMNSQDRGLDNSERIYSLVIFELWRREYGVSL